MRRRIGGRALAGILIPALFARDLGAAMFPLPSPGVPYSAFRQRPLPPSRAISIPPRAAASRSGASFHWGPAFSGPVRLLRLPPRLYACALGLGGRLAAEAAALDSRTRRNFLPPLKREPRAHTRTEPAPLPSKPPASPELSAWRTVLNAPPRDRLPRLRSISFRGRVGRLVRLASVYPVADMGPATGGFQTLSLRRESSVRSGAFLAAANALPASSSQTTTLADGTRVTASYDASQPYGQRTRYTIEGANGSRQDYVSSPLVLDLDGGGFATRAERVPVDIDGDGRLDRVHDLRRGLGLLVFDADRDGRPGEDAGEFFGDGTDVDGDGTRDHFADGFAALDAFVRRAVRDGVLPPRVLAEGRLGRRELAALARDYGLALRVGGFGGRTLALPRAGVSAILLSADPAVRTPNFDGRGSILVRKEGAAFLRRDGSEGRYADVWLERSGERPASLARATRTK